ncbi:MAG: DUF1206 domain-containing protein, partial [Xanthobacteraceae bacterium]
ARRAFYGANALFYAGLAGWTASLAFARRGGPDNDQEVRDWTAWLMAQPLGRVAVGVLGAAITAGKAVQNQAGRPGQASPARPAMTRGRFTEQPCRTRGEVEQAARHAHR